MNTNVQKIMKYPEILRLFLKYPKRNFTPLQISKISKVPYPTARRYVLNLNAAGLLDIERVGAYNVCKLNAESPLIPEIKNAVNSELSPHKLAVKEFVKQLKSVKQIKKAILFGSVARGTENLRSDVDVAIIVEKDSKLLEKKLVEIMDKILQSSRMKVIPITLTEFEAKENKQFEDELKKGVVIYERRKRV